MSKAIVREIANADTFIALGERSLNKTMIKSRHGSIEINEALMLIGKAKILLEKAAIKELEAGDRYE